MTPKQKKRIRELFLAACEKDARQRDEFLRHACADDELLRREVESLLANDDETDDFLSTPALGGTFADAHPASLMGKEPVPSSSAVPERIGEYRIIDVLGQGGMGVVYRAEQENPRRTVALKVIRPGVESGEVLRRFELEAQVLGRLQHPGITQIFEAGTSDAGHGPQPFFAMELVDGRPLTEYVRTQNLDIGSRMELVAKICEAVHHAHQKGVIHRDLKPGNILVDESAQPKILDFGIARATDAGVQGATLAAAAGQLVGTIAYMSPEQVEGDIHDIDTRSDIYSVGVIMYELLTGQIPVDVTARTVPQAVRAIVEEEPTSLGSVDRVFRGDVETIVAKALEKDRNRRYQAASDLADDIRRHLSDQPINARPSTTMYQLQKFASRNKGLVTGVVVAFVMLCVALVGVTLQRNRALDAEQLAEQQRRMAQYKAYAANVAAAQAALGADDVVAARRQLELAPSELRNFEWRYLHAQLDQSLLAVNAHEDRVWMVAFSPDGARIATASRDKTARILDVQTGAMLKTLSDSQVGFCSITYSPDGRCVATGLEDGRIVLWNADTGDPITTLRGHKWKVECLTYSQDGSLLASTSLDTSVRVWDVNAGETIAVLEHPSWVYFASFNADATRLATSCRDNQLRIWDLTEREPMVLEVLSPPAGTREVIHGWPVAYSPDGRILAAGSHDGSIRLWDARSGELLRAMSGHTDRMRTLAFGPAGLRLASASFDRTLRVWDAAEGIEVAKFVGHEEFVLSVAYSPDGGRLASGGQDGSVRIWDPRMSNGFMELRGHENRGIRAIAITNDGSRLVSVGEDSVVRIWDASSGAGLWAMRGHEAWIYDVAISLDGELAATASADGKIGLWNIATGDRIALLSGHDDEVVAVAFSPVAAQFASVGRDGVINLWDVATRSVVSRIRCESDALTAIEFSPDGRTIATGSSTGDVELWNARDGRRLAAIRAHTGAISHVAFSPSGELLASASHDSTLSLLDARDLSILHTLVGHADVVSCAAFSPDGSRLASASHDRNLRIWDMETAETVLSFRAHNEYVFGVEFSPDGAWLASSAKTIRLWETARPDPNVLEQRRARVEAEALVEHLSAESNRSGDVIARIRSEPGVSDRVRQLAVQIALFRSP